MRAFAASALALAFAAADPIDDARECEAEHVARDCVFNELAFSAMALSGDVPLFRNRCDGHPLAACDDVVRSVCQLAALSCPLESRCFTVLPSVYVLLYTSAVRRTPS